MRVQFNGQPAFDSNMMWGYMVEVTPEGVFGEVPEELLELEIGAGRVKRPAKVEKVEPKTEEVDVAQKRQGRPPKQAE